MNHAEQDEKRINSRAGALRYIVIWIKAKWKKKQYFPIFLSSVLPSEIVVFHSYSLSLSLSFSFEYRICICFLFSYYFFINLRSTCIFNMNVYFFTNMYKYNHWLMFNFSSPPFFAMNNNNLLNRISFKLHWMCCVSVLRQYDNWKSKGWLAWVMGGCVCAWVCLCVSDGEMIRLGENDLTNLEHRPEIV